MPNSTAPNLQAVLDERDIGQLLARCARILDQRDFDSLDTVFSEDLSFDYGFGGGEEHGVAAMHQILVDFLGNCGPTQHLGGSLLVEVDGDSAKSQIYILARHQGDGELSDRFYDASGEWHDDWVREAGGWRIVRRDVTMNVSKGDPAALGSKLLEG